MPIPDWDIPILDGSAPAGHLQALFNGYGTALNTALNTLYLNQGALFGTAADREGAKSTKDQFIIRKANGNTGEADFDWHAIQITEEGSSG